MTSRDEGARWTADYRNKKIIKHNSCQLLPRSTKKGQRGLAHVALREIIYQAGVERGAAVANHEHVVSGAKDDALLQKEGCGDGVIAESLPLATGDWFAWRRERDSEPSGPNRRCKLQIRDCCHRLRYHCCHGPLVRCCPTDLQRSPLG